MILIERKLLDNIIYLEIVNKNLKNQALPTVIFYHGWTNVKESALVAAYELANCGIRAILPDAFEHGERSTENKLKAVDFWSIIARNIAEYPVLINHLVDEKKTDLKRVGASGLSMGGITTAALLTQFDWIKSAAILMGSASPLAFTDWQLNTDNPSGLSKDKLSEFNSTTLKETKDYLRSISLDLQPEKLANRPVYFWHDVKDEWIPYEQTRSVFIQLKNTPYGRNLFFQEGNGEGHHVPHYAFKAMAEHFESTL